MNRLLLALTVIALVPTTTPTSADDRHARLKPFIGRTVADFMQSTGLTPSDAYETAQGRVFVVHGPPIGVAVAPGVVVAGGCKLQIEATPVGTRSAADAWVIRSITAHGPC